MAAQFNQMLPQLGGGGDLVQFSSLTGATVGPLVGSGKVRTHSGPPELRPRNSTWARLHAFSPWNAFRCEGRARLPEECTVVRNSGCYRVAEHIYVPMLHATKFRPLVFFF